MTLLQLFNALRARRTLFLGILGLSILVAMVVNLLLPTEYKATTAVLADPKLPDPVYGSLMLQNGVPVMPGHISTQVDIILSDRVAQLAVRQLGLDKDPAARAKWQESGDNKGTIEQFYAGRIRRDLEVRPSRESNVVNISYEAHDPRFAAAVTNAFARAYVETTVDLKAEPARSTAKWFDARSAQSREALEAAQTRLSAFQKTSGITGGDEKLDVETARLNELSTQLTAVQGQRSESSSRDRQAQTAVATSPDVLQNPLVQSLRADVARSEVRLRDLGQMYGENHPEYQRAAVERATLRNRLQIEMAQVAGSVGSANRVNLQREAEIRAALEAQKKRVLDLRSKRDELALLQKDVEAAQKAHDMVLQRLSQSNLEAQSQQTTVNILSEALPPSEPSRPRALVNVIVAAFLGLFLGAFAAVVQEARDRRLRNADDVESLLELPVIAHIASAGPASRVAELVKPRRPALA